MRLTHKKAGGGLRVLGARPKWLAAAANSSNQRWNQVLPKSVKIIEAK